VPSVGRRRRAEVQVGGSCEGRRSDRPLLAAAAAAAPLLPHAAAIAAAPPPPEVAPAGTSDSACAPTHALAAVWGGEEKTTRGGAAGERGGSATASAPPLPAEDAEAMSPLPVATTGAAAPPPLDAGAATSLRAATRTDVPPSAECVPEGRRHCRRTATGGLSYARGWTYTADAVSRGEGWGTNPAPVVGARVDSLPPGEKGAAAHLAAKRQAAGRGAGSAGTGGL